MQLKNPKPRKSKKKKNQISDAACRVRRSKESTVSFALQFIRVKDADSEADCGSEAGNGLVVLGVDISLDGVFALFER